MDKNAGNNSNSFLIIFLMFFIPALILARGIYDIHVKKTGIMPLIPASKADFSSDGDSGDCEAEGSESESEGCP